MVDKKSKKQPVDSADNSDKENVRVVLIPKREPVDPQKIYDEVYVPNMSRRGITAEIKPYEKWVRHIKSKDKNGEEIIKTVPGETGESKEEKGTRLLSAYFNAAVESLDRIKNLTSPQYKLNEKQIKLLHDKLVEKINEIDSAFAGKTKESAPVDFSKIE